ncbi:MAG: PhnD/SsuA/transferrin family substrate-binding protein [Victivallales bacterium]|nr:PhnD/SsuA/transferrin family substrate-binding protein [Victivallales bacterium]
MTHWTGISMWLPALALVLVAPGPLSGAPPSPVRRVVRIGILANDAPGVCHRRWGATADYLTSELNGFRFEIIPVAFDGILATASQGSVDFLLTNPAQVIQLVAEDLCLPVATLKGRFYGGDYAGVVFWSARRFDIRGARDLPGRTVAAVSQLSLGGWLAQKLEYQEAGIDLAAQAKGVAFQQSHEDVVRAVLAGQADMGFCRTGVLEAMAARREIGLDEVRIGTDFVGAGDRRPRHHSTRLYPEWPLLALNHVPNTLVEDVRLVLLDMPPTDTAARDSSTAGWMAAANYGQVRRCLRILKAPPFDRPVAAVPSGRGWLLATLALASVFVVLVCAILFLRLRSMRHMLDTELAHETVLGRSRSFLAAVVGSFPYPMLVIGLDYRVLLANPKAREVYGWREEDEVMPCHRFLREKGHPCHDLGEGCLLRKVIDSAQHEVIHTVHRYADGEEVAVCVHGAPVFGPDGELHAIAEWAIDERDDPASQTASFPVS